MIRALLVDDEELARQELGDLLSHEPDITIIGEVANGLEAVEAIPALKPDLLFLDIEMPGLNGFEVINSLQTIPPVVFATAYDQYAIQAFEVNAIDYLLKPITATRLQRTLARARETQGSDNTLQQQAALHHLMTELRRNRSSYISRLAVQKGRRIVLVRLRDIIYIEIDAKLVFVCTAAGRFVVNKTISELEQSLVHEGFFRINRSTIVNLDFLDEIIPWFSATCILKLSNGLELPLSRERVACLKEVVGLLKQKAEK
jgi:DNA-binding LytR/AlgR family response regulator